MCRLLKLARLAFVASLALNPAVWAAGPFKESAGPYKGSGTIGSLGVFVSGSAEGTVRKRGSGGMIVLRSTISFSGQTRRIYRTLTFKRRTYTSSSQILNGFMDHVGYGAGECSIKKNRVSYSENTLFTFPSSNTTQPYQIYGRVAFNRRSVVVSETWDGGNFGTNTYTFELRPR